MKIGVVTFFNYCNYGAALQCYGLSETLKAMGHEVSYIDYTCPFIGRPFTLNSLKKRGAFGFVYTLAGNFFYLPRRPGFRRFRALIGHTQPAGPDNIHTFGDCFDKYITGSDQVWSTKLTDFDKTYFLNFVRDPRKKFSYSASFGGAAVNPAHQDEIAGLLRDFNAISVREQYGAEIVRELAGREAAVTLDPTLLLRKSDWERVAAPRQTKREPYILVYQLGFSQALIRTVKDLQKKTGCKVEYIPFPLGGAVNCSIHLALDPGQWLARFRDADYVVTDSYHGIIFSLLFEKKFVVVANGQHKNQRVISLLTRLGLTDRILEEGSADVDREIDYAAVKAILEEDRQASLRWLREHI